MSSSEETQKFIALFNIPKDVEIIPWDGDDNVGFSVLRTYPEDGRFIPAKRKDKSDDSVVLIRVGYIPEQVNKNNKVNLLVDAFKTSRYLSNGRFDYDFDDADSPTRSSVEASKHSQQPYDLENYSQYEYDVGTKMISDTEQGHITLTNPYYVIGEIYQQHISTTGNIVFKAKVSLRSLLTKFSDPIIGLLKINNLFFFGKEIIPEKENFLAGFFEPYKHKQLQSLSPERINFLGTDLVTSQRTLITLALTLMILYTTRFYTHFDVLRALSLVGQYQNSPIFITSFGILSLWFFDYLIPHATLTAINLLIRIKVKALHLKIRI